MGKAFVAKLAQKGARDPEALAAWIGRQKHGRRAFQNLAKAGREQAEQHRELVGRVRPGGRLTSDLTGFSDVDLGRVLSDLNQAEASRVAAEMDRRDIAASLPGARADLIGVSDEELGRRLGSASAEESAAIAAEMDRRQLMAEVFPESSLTSDLSGVSEQKLGWALSYARPDEAARIAAEMDRRHPPQPLPAASGDPAADRAAMDELLGSNPDNWAHLSEDFPDDPRDSMTATERWLAEREEAEASARASYSRQQLREMYREHVYDQVIAAEEALNGVLLSRKARAQGVDPVSLFTGPSHVAYARASEELKRWWQDHPRTTLAEFEDQVTGQRSQAGETSRRARTDQQNRL
jgi:hypothetical protein